MPYERAAVVDHGAVTKLVIVLALVGCGNRERERDRGPAPPPTAPATKPERTADAAELKNTCALRDVELVYVIDTEHVLSSFDPKLLPNDPFHEVGTLACHTATTPNSMAVDRMGVAWINYHSGFVHRASIVDGKCVPGAKPIGAPKAFGMGFVTDGPQAETEKLFVASIEDTGFAELEVAANRPRWRPVGNFSGAKNPELTGTGGGQLFGFFPSDDGKAFISEIDKSSGALVGKPLEVGAPVGHVEAWAFAHWGGRFYVFVTIDGNSMVIEVDGKTRESKRVREKLPARIVGAGVSTCAPLLESVPP